MKYKYSSILTTCENVRPLESPHCLALRCKPMCIGDKADKVKTIFYELSNYVEIKNVN